MASLTIAGDTSGSITLSAPSVAGSNVLSLPASTGTVLTTGSPQSGGVIQVVSATYSTSVTTSAGPVDTGLTATITPKFSTSKVLVLVMQVYYIYGGGADTGAIYTLLRSGSSIYTSSGHSIYVANSSATAESIANYTINYLDSPATTSATTYKTQATATGGGNVASNWNSNPSTIILMEIAA